jgi:hypothetical protein
VKIEKVVHTKPAIFFSLLLLQFSFFTLTSQVNDPDYVLKNPRDFSKDPARNANFIELGGNGGLYSINFDRIFLYKENFKISGRAGFNIFPVGYQIEQSYLLENNYIFFKNPHHLEIGPGLTLQEKYNPSCANDSIYKWESVWFAMMRVGYRYQKQEDGFFFRAAVLPIFYTKNSCYSEFPPTNWFWAGVAVGVSF